MREITFRNSFTYSYCNNILCILLEAISIECLFIYIFFDQVEYWMWINFFLQITLLKEVPITHRLYKKLTLFA